jgi:hypothetical protein
MKKYGVIFAIFHRMAGFAFAILPPSPSFWRQALPVRECFNSPSL